MPARVGTPSAGKTGHRGDHRLWRADLTSDCTARAGHQCLRAVPRGDREQGLGRGRNAIVIWQDLVSDHGFPHGYQTVKRFVRKVRGSESSQVVGIILTPAGEKSQAD